MGKTWTTITDILGGRKFLVFVAATILVVLDIITAHNWMWVAGLYMGSNVADGVIAQIGGK